MPELAHHLAALIAHYGLPALFLSVALEALGAPLPGESAIIVAAGAAAAGELDIRSVAVTAFLAAVLGDNIGYLIGRQLRPLRDRPGRRPLRGHRGGAGARRRHRPPLRPGRWWWSPASWCCCAS